MEALVRHLVLPIVQHPDDVTIDTTEGDAVITLSLDVHPDDHATVDGERGRTLRSVRSILSAAAGSKKATLDLVGGDDEQADGDDGDVDA